MERAYKSAGMTAYSLDDVLLVFRHYFQRYEETFKAVHPNIRLAQIERLIIAMPYIDGDEKSGAGGYITVDEYTAMIDAHFKTQYRSCDYNINHFFSGDIRLLRYYETAYWREGERNAGERRKNK
jgi:hypothetical protein